MSDFLLAPARPAHAAFTWATRGSSCRYLTYDFTAAKSVRRVEAIYRPADAALLTQTIALLSRFVHTHAAGMGDEELSQLMNCITDLDKRREEIELAATPGWQAGIERAAQRLAQRPDYEPTYLAELV